LQLGLANQLDPVKSAALAHGAQVMPDTWAALDTVWASLCFPDGLISPLSPLQAEHIMSFVQHVRELVEAQQEFAEGAAVALVADVFTKL